MLIQPAELDREIAKKLVYRSISQDRLQVNEVIQEETDHLPLPVQKKPSLGFGQFQVGLNIGKRATQVSAEHSEEPQSPKIDKKSLFAPSLGQVNSVQSLMKATKAQVSQKQVSLTSWGV